MEQVQSYTFSRGLRRAKERFTILAIVFPAILVAFIFLSPMLRDTSLGFKIGLGFFMLVFLGLVFYFSSSRALRRLSEMSVSIFPDRLERVSRKDREVFLWKDLQQVEVVDYPDGELAVIKLSFAGRKSVLLSGFEDMEAFLGQMEPAIPGEAPVRRKRMKLNWDQPGMLILSALVTLAVILLIQQLGERAYRFFNALFVLGFGIIYLIYRPLSSAQGKAWKTWETVSGILLIILGVFLLVLELFLL